MRISSPKEFIISMALCFFFVYNVQKIRNSSLEFSPPLLPLVTVVKNADKGMDSAFRLKRHFLGFVRSLLRNRRKSRFLLHLIVLTDKSSAGYLNRLVRNELAVQTESPNIRVDYIDIEYVLRRFRSEIRKLKPYFTSLSENARKYTDDLFMMAPFYHRIFPFSKMIALDVDLDFRINIEELYSLFERFRDVNIMGVAPDLAPHYRIVLKRYREKNPGTHIGEPGRFQGFNTGVMLFDLEKIRRNALFNRLIDNVDGEIDALCSKYYYKSHLGDQCFFTLLGLEYPDLFYNLDCAYNYQLDISLSRQPWTSIFELYHKCNAKPKIYHGNGGAQIPDINQDIILKLMNSTMKPFS